jgi:hypothetical protein
VDMQPMWMLLLQHRCPRVATPCSEAVHLGVVEFDGAFSLAQSICSYGYFGLAPNRWLPAPPHEINDDAGVFERPLVFGKPHHEEWCALVGRSGRVGGW